MARISFILRRGATYSARLKVPVDLVELVGKKELVKSLATKDENEAKRIMWPVVESWNRHFDDLRSRRVLTADDKAEAVWQHYTGTLECNEQTRQNSPRAKPLVAEVPPIKAPSRMPTAERLAPSELLESLQGVRRRNDRLLVP